MTSKPHSVQDDIDTVRYYLNIVAEEDAHAQAIAALDGLVEQLETYEKALREIVYLPDETEAYSYADACVNIARTALSNPAKGRE